MEYIGMTTSLFVYLTNVLWSMD